MSPAGSASRAGDTPEASGDSSSGTLGNKTSHSMKRFIPYLATVLLSLAIGYVIGGYRATYQAAIASNAHPLIWLTAIHEMINRGDYNRANKMIEAAVDVHVDGISLVEREPGSIFPMLMPWAPDLVGRVRHSALLRANEYFVEKTDVLRPETREFLVSSQKTK